MPRNLREEIERADRDRKQKEHENSQRENWRNNEKNQIIWLEQQRGDRYLQEARGYFSKHIFPLFSELAGVMGVNMNRDAYVASFFAFGSGNRESIPQRNGFSKTEKIVSGQPAGQYQVFSANVQGDLVWDFNAKGDRDESSWRHIVLGVTNEALTIGLIESVNLMSRGGLLELETKFLDCVRRGGDQDSYWMSRNRNAPDSP